MERLSRSEATVVPALALVLAGAAAAALEVGARLVSATDSAEALFSLFWLGGWALLVLAALLGGGYAVLLGARARSRRPVLRREIAMTAVALLLVVAVAVVNPVLGSGAGSA